MGGPEAETTPNIGFNTPHLCLTSHLFDPNAVSPYSLSCWGPPHMVEFHGARASSKPPQGFRLPNLKLTVPRLAKQNGFNGIYFLRTVSGRGAQ